MRSSLAQAPSEPMVKDEWLQDYPPFRIVGNLYYVGSYDLACYLIATPEGHILINAGSAASGPMLCKHVEALGFRVSDIKVLLISQAHYDHVGSLAEMKRLSGAKVMVQERDAEVLADGGRSDYYFSGYGPTFTPVKPDRLLHDGDDITLGGTHLTALLHAGHTKGSCSYLLQVADSARTYRVLIANMPSVIVEVPFGKVTGYPEISTDYKRTFTAMKKLRFDLWVAAHASQFRLQDKHQPGDPYRPEAFRDQKGYETELFELEKGYKKWK